MLTPEQLQSIEDCGGAEMPIEETCLIVECAENEFMASEEARARYRLGQLRSKLSIRQAVVKMAKDGVPQAVKLYQDFGSVELPQLPSPDDDDELMIDDDELTEGDDGNESGQ